MFKMIFVAIEKYHETDFNETFCPRCASRKMDMYEVDFYFNRFGKLITEAYVIIVQSVEFKNK